MTRKKDTNTTLRKVGSDVRKMRKDLRYSQDAFCKIAKLSKPTLVGIERGEANPTYRALQALANAGGKKLKINFES